MEEANLTKFEALSQADSIEEGALTFYRQLIKQFPEWESVLVDRIESSIKNKGKIQALRDSIEETTKQLFEEGKEEGERQLDTLFVDPEVLYNIDNKDEISIMAPLGGDERVLTLLNL